MGKIKKTFIKANIFIIVVLALLMVIFSFGTGNGVMLFIFGMGIIYTVLWTVAYVLVFGTLSDLLEIFKR